MTNANEPLCLSRDQKHAIWKFVTEHNHELAFDRQGLIDALLLLLPQATPRHLIAHVDFVLSGEQPAVFNLTPHEIALLREGKSPCVFPPSGVVARATVTRILHRRITVGWDNMDYADNPDGELLPIMADVYSTTVGALTGLPAYQAGRFYIVSRLILDAVARSEARTALDLLVPDDLLRDEAGIIVGCHSFATV